MSGLLEELPLFPLHTVLFPYAQLQLHVFEDRYREMVRSCVEFDRPFGIVLIREGSEVGGIASPYMVGTAVRILKVIPYDDGRMDIYVEGERRFRIRELDEDSQPYLVGRVEPVIEIEIEPNDQNEVLLIEAKDQFEQLIQKVFARQEFNVSVKLPTDPVVLSFTIANMLHMENLAKQRLLETTDTMERMATLMPILQLQNLEAREPNYYRIGSEDLSEWITPN
ncbi:MAG: LON peptidase substrate-binding domain-containing protein [Fimbriimonadaceae bacterium]|nr:LON peptidase substrate-binding domain-containing protein [Fimbriimonadaceae bacterium]